MKYLALTFTLLCILVLTSFGCGKRQVDLLVKPMPQDHVWQQTELTAKFKSRIHITLANPNPAGKDDDWTYNLVILDKRDTPEEVAAMVADVGLYAEKADAATGSVPENHPAILWFSPPVKPGETATIDFASPPPGDYPYICTIDGRWKTMQGVLRIVR